MKNWRKPTNIKHEIHQESTLPSHINLIIKPFSPPVFSALRTSLLRGNFCECLRNEAQINSVSGNLFASTPPSLLPHNKLFFSPFPFQFGFGFTLEWKYWGWVLWELYKHFRNARRRNGHNVFYYRFTSVFLAPTFSSIGVKSRFLNKNFYWDSSSALLRNNLWKNIHIDWVEGKGFRNEIFLGS